MKTMFMILALLIGTVPSVSAESGGGTLFSKTAQAVGFNYDMDVDNYQRFSIQLDYNDSAPTAATVSDGEYSTATITVADYAALAYRASSVTITLASGKNTYAALHGKSVTLKGTPFTEGVEWNYSAVSSTITAKSLSDAIDAHHEFSTTVSSNVITVSAASKGTYSNGWTVASSTPAALVLSAATFTQGQDRGYLTIDGTTIYETTDFTAETSNTATATNIYTAIGANATMAAIVTAANPTAGVVTIHSNTTGFHQYILGAYPATALSPNYYRMVNGAASDISVADNTFLETAHTFGNNLAVVFHKVSGTQPTGLVSGTTYYVIPVDANTFKVSLTSSAAGPGTAVDITALIGSGSFTFTPRAFVSAATTGFKYYGSNDGTTYYDLSITSAGYNTTGDSGLLSTFTDYAYRYLRAAFVAPTAGGMDMKGTVHWRRD